MVITQLNSLPFQKLDAKYGWQYVKLYMFVSQKPSFIYKQKWNKSKGFFTRRCIK
jgi:hypothetical protein